MIKVGASARDHIITIALGVLGLAVMTATLAPQSAQAIPSFARQTGQPCAACHTAFPELTPFGRRFKLNGYTLQGGDNTLPRFSFMFMPTFSHTKADQDAPPIPGTNVNNNLILQQATLLYGGQIYGGLGAFAQLTWDRVSNQVYLDGSDFRYAEKFTLFGKDATWGVTVNNSPTVQDVWNTTPAFGFPQLASTIAPAFTPPLTHIEGSWANQVAGAGAYVFWNDMLYAELTGYKGLTHGQLEALNEPGASTADGLNGLAPYWRLAVEPHWGDHYWELGTFGMYGQVIPGGITGFGTDNYTDVGIDSQYQYDGDPYSVTIKATNIMEWQKLNNSFVQGVSSNLNNRLDSFKLDASFVWDHTYSFTGGYFNVSGTSDALLYGASSAINSPNGSGLIFDAAYLPFSHGSPWPYSSYNARIGVTYTHYLKLFGGTSNFDGSGLGNTHSSSGNDTIFVYAWLAF